MRGDSKTSPNNRTAKVVRNDEMVKGGIGKNSKNYENLTLLRIFNSRFLCFWTVFYNFARNIFITKMRLTTKNFKTK